MLKKIEKILCFAFGSGAMINTRKLELPLSRTYFHSSKGVRAIEVRLYLRYAGVYVIIFI